MAPSRWAGRTAVAGLLGLLLLGLMALPMTTRKATTMQAQVDEFWGALAAKYGEVVVQ